MPELPEVEVVRAGLEPAVTGATITSVDVLDARSLKRHNVASGIFVDVLEGRQIVAAVRRGKFLWFPLDNGTALVTHLGMSGQMLLRLPGTDDRLTRIRIGIESPDHGELLVNFVDQRIFGGMAVDSLLPTPDGFPGGFSGAVVGPAVVPSQVAHIARDPLDPAFDDNRFFSLLGRKTTGVKRALLDQTLISGIGNIYADEALWAAKIHYEQAASSLSKRRAALLLTEVRAVLQKALAEGGTSFDAQYVNVNGASGYFAHSLNAYGRENKPCTRCGTAIRREKFMNRSSHFCPKCQRRR
ncbi:bifunctional DNA-formamidopyrimidine glycosylase/DNA-(apurinic or apyrimidinic site) lyase [Mycetocola zhadangensis]|uniref:Formamidopyrimidine-DNA glycosylase n=1 Tax=Mycetocola zhadangensis TaxID=1164595 RepID=A0A3L7J5G0_9MICO|nr:bifunctional DNA-formamidopyrimidine glycosylase/DNA-(apurinic or apyrimidinic site) lyase [Mycetocola zhadangensis]RLQ85843.1 bifunctional DNA-formamidopyrimidine glycosylase/DNA-(apurinic or apyrimidinic site) lyase [Mycetocola zhadangensis]GGE86328.1 formamidopyrimidine-DNA glycosylase [Mycetocola zhadangensis]